MPISLIVTVETVKFFQGVQLGHRGYMHTVLKDSLGLPTGEVIKPVAQMSSLNDELGQVNYVLTDKTGTLTQNKMVFHKLLVGDSVYSDILVSPIQDKAYDEGLLSALKSGARMNNREVHALRCLSLCHNVIFDDKQRYERVKASNAINREHLAKIYGVKPEDIITFMFFEPALAFKLTLRRDTNQGSIGERDTFGAQQHAPFFDLEVPEAAPGA